MSEQFGRVHVGASTLGDPCGAPKPLPILIPSDFVPENGFPVVKALNVRPGYEYEFSKVL